MTMAMTMRRASTQNRTRPADMMLSDVPLSAASCNVRENVNKASHSWPARRVCSPSRDPQYVRWMRTCDDNRTVEQPPKVRKTVSLWTHNSSLSLSRSSLHRGTGNSHLPSESHVRRAALVVAVSYGAWRVTRHALVSPSYAHIMRQCVTVAPCCYFARVRRGRGRGAVRRGAAVEWTMTVARRGEEGDGGAGEGEWGSGGRGGMRDIVSRASAAPESGRSLPTTENSGWGAIDSHIRKRRPACV